MKLPQFLYSIVVLGIFASSCSPSQGAIETAVAQTMTALPTMTPYPTLRPTITPSPTQTPTATPTPVREDLGISLEEIQSVFENYGFSFELIRLVAGESVMRGEYNEAVDVYLTARDSNLVRVDYGIPLYINIDEVSIPSHGEVVVEVLGEVIYQSKFSPWAKDKVRTFREALCFDGIMIKRYYSEWSDSLELNIMVEQEWDEDIGGCR